jgi:hypothetical protein
MPIFLDPDFNELPLLPSTLQSRYISAGKRVFLESCISSPWEQALVIYLGDDIYPHQIGSYLRPTFLEIPAQPQDYMINLLAFHKRSHANEWLPWVPSAGQSAGPITIAWDDSAEDGDYRDLRINLLTD